MRSGPRIAEKKAAMMERIAPKEKDNRNEGINALARVVGNQVVPVRVFMVSGLIVATTDCGTATRMAFTGLYPRNAANNAPVGGIALMGAIRFEAPICVSDIASSGGNKRVKLTITIVKNRAMDVTIPLFCSIALIPDATPRSSGGTEFMMAAMFGAPNMPFPRPIIKRARAKTG